MRFVVTSIGAVENWSCTSRPRRTRLVMTIRRSIGERLRTADILRDRVHLKRSSSLRSQTTSYRFDSNSDSVETAVTLCVRYLVTGAWRYFSTQ
ncbi:hypothetical protein NG2371_05975 [Nocardia gamkensis]|nr:hypothetical protein [Nocardia gamkensis]